MRDELRYLASKQGILGVGEDAGWGRASINASKVEAIARRLAQEVHKAIASTGNAG